MANQFVQYPYVVHKTANGYMICPFPDSADQFEYVFATMADLTYWMGLNEQQQGA